MVCSVAPNAFLFRRPCSMLCSLPHRNSFVPKQKLSHTNIFADKWDFFRHVFVDLPPNNEFESILKELSYFSKLGSSPCVLRGPV